MYNNILFNSTIRFFFKFNLIYQHSCWINQLYKLTIMRHIIMYNDV